MFADSFAQHEQITADKIREAQPSFNPSAIPASAVKPMETRSFFEGVDYEKSKGRFKCLTCGREMLDHIKEHLMTHSNDKNVFCPICHKRFITGKTLFRWMQFKTFFIYQDWISLPPRLNSELYKEACESFS